MSPSDPRPRRRRRPADAMFVVVPAVVVAVLLLRAGWVLAAVVGCLVAFVLYSAAKAPSRHRRHGWGQIWQAIGNESGMSGDEYPEDSLGTQRYEDVGRNEACPCGSGRKYKHCCGAEAR